MKNTTNEKIVKLIGVVLAIVLFGIGIGSVLGVVWEPIFVPRWLSLLLIYLCGMGTGGFIYIMSLGVKEVLDIP